MQTKLFLKVLHYRFTAKFFNDFSWPKTKKCSSTNIHNLYIANKNITQNELLLSEKIWVRKSDKCREESPEIIGWQ
jgi:hypothetical protein